MTVYGNWRTATIANGATASGEVDLGDNYDFLDVILPTLTSGTLKVQVSDKSGGTFQDLGKSLVVAATTGAYSTVFRLGGWHYVKIVSGAAQAADRSILVRGLRP